MKIILSSKDEQNGISTILITKNNIIDYENSFTTSTVKILKDQFFIFYRNLANNLYTSCSVKIFANNVPFIFKYCQNKASIEIPSTIRKKPNVVVYEAVIHTQEMINTMRKYIMCVYNNINEIAFNVDIISGYSKSIDGINGNHVIAINKNNSYVCSVVIKDAIYRYEPKNKLYILNEQLHQEQNFLFEFDGYITNDINTSNIYEKLIVSYKNNKLKFKSRSGKITVNLNEYNKKDICSSMTEINNENWY